MSYDLYLYRSSTTTPDEDEADSVIEADKDRWAKKERHPAVKLAIVKALKVYNPKLEATDFQYGDVSKLGVDIIEKEIRKFDHIEINHPEDEPGIRLIVYDNHVSFDIPYGYEDTRKLFDYIKAYVRIINETAGYFVFDPQLGEVFDPKATDWNGEDMYLSV
jgi:hypothetical protein